MISNAPALAFRVLEIPLVPKGTLLGAALSDGLPWGETIETHGDEL